MTDHLRHALDDDEFHGFNQARSLLGCYEARARVRARLSETAFLDDPAVTAVHVENISRIDRVFLTAFDRFGRLVASETLYVDEPAQRLDVTPEFDHDFTGLEVQEETQLAEAIAREDGWVIDMTVLRNYDVVMDRRATQRAVFLAHLADLMANGQARGFMLDQFGDSAA